MAEKVVIHRIDDLTGQHGADVELVDFGLDGVDYEIDLSADNADQLRASLDRYLAVARKAGSKTTNSQYRASSGGNAKKGKEDAAARKERIKAIRTWAADQDEFNISEYGRLPVAVEQAYDKAMAAKNGAPPAVETGTVDVAEIGWEPASVPVPAFSG